MTTAEMTLEQKEEYIKDQMKYLTEKERSSIELIRLGEPITGLEKSVDACIAAINLFYASKSVQN